MKVAIISDIHDNLVNLEKCLNWCRDNKIDKIICCGDITNSETLEYLAKHFKNDIFLVRGNAEIYEEKELENYKNINFFGSTGIIKLDKKNIGFCHQPYLTEKVLKKGVCDFIFYGHTHKPWIEERKDLKIMNPGTLGGMFQKGTFVVWDTKSDKLELEILELLK